MQLFLGVIHTEERIKPWNRALKPKIFIHEMVNHIEKDDFVFISLLKLRLSFKDDMFIKINLEVNHRESTNVNLSFFPPRHGMLICSLWT